MSGSQANSPVASRIYGVLTNSVAGTIAIVLLFLFLPAESVNISKILDLLITYNLITTPLLLVFFVISYIIGQMIQAFTEFVPFRYGISGVFRFFPFMPKFRREEVDDRYKDRFSWTCEHLFYDLEGISKPEIYVPLNKENLDLASSYLRNKNVPQIQVYENISSTFAQLEILFIASLVASAVIIHPKNIMADGIQFTEFNISLDLFLWSIGFYFFSGLQSWLDRKTRNLRQNHRDRNVDLRLLTSGLGNLLLFATVASVFLLFVPFETDYESNLSNFLGEWFKYSPIIFIILTYSSAYVKYRYSKMKRHVVIRDLYVVALSEGDINKLE